MNNMLELKGIFKQESRKQAGPIAMNSKEVVSSERLDDLYDQITSTIQFWEKERSYFSGILISVHYNKIVAKSNRINGLFKKKKSNDAIVGAKYNADKTKHIITYFLTSQDLLHTADRLSEVKKILEMYFNGQIDKETFDNSKMIEKIKFADFKIAKTLFQQIIADVSYIDRFSIEKQSNIFDASIVTLYDTKTDIRELLTKLGIDSINSRILDNQTVLLEKNEVELLLDKAPYLVAMATHDLSDLVPDEFNSSHPSMMSIPSPTIEPTIGVIDTLFATSVYFSSWVTYKDMVDEAITKEQKDYNHGTGISSIIVDGPSLNPWLDDGCGRFRVRHFGVAVGGQFSSFSIIKQIKEIIATNSDIKVWNFSLGSNQEINDNFISAESAILDQIQTEYDVIFVIAGTNKQKEKTIKIGSPADSINSLVVNAVTKDGLCPEYARRGLALSFFAKPDVSYYGGSKEQYIQVYEPLGGADVAGTSYAAPWIARKLAYLIDILGFSREAAKALIIDAARGWTDSPTAEEVSLYGHGIVPKRIEDIIQTDNDEIKFLVTGISEKYNTYNYKFPIPMKDDKYPYVVRATMCYFPLCTKTQGVDYTNTELNIRFGRINNNNKISPINKDTQSQGDDLDFERSYILEADARKYFRKWDNVKYVTEGFKERRRPKRSYTEKNWGMEIQTKNRLDGKDGEGLHFAVVVTLKEINGVNRIEEFIKNCYLNGWLVNEINIKTSIDIHQAMLEDIEFE
jgi:hypothetical protein